MKILRTIALLFVTSIVLVLIALFLPISARLDTQPKPAQDYEEAMIRVVALQGRDTNDMFPECHSLLLTHGHRVDHAIVFFHGIANCPAQFAELGQRFFDLGYNVLIPRLPHHGYADPMTTEPARLSAEELVASADEAVDIAVGLGEQVAFVGFSTGGTVAAWVAQQRPDVGQTVLLSAFLSPKGFPSWVLRPLTRILLLAQEGAKVALLSRTPTQINEVAKEINNSGGEAIAIQGDISNVEHMQNAVQKIIDTWGRLDIVIANAGINGVWASLEELTPEEWDTTLNINLKGTFLTVKYALPHLKKQGGAIVVVSSVNGTRMFSNTGATAYACSKAAQVAFTKMVALELAPHKVRINCICPGWITSEIRENTDLRNIDTIRYPREFPKGTVPLTQGKPGSSEQVADLIFFLSSNASSHITGTEMWIDGAQSLLQG